MSDDQRALPLLDESESALPTPKEPQMYYQDNIAVVAVSDLAQGDVIVVDPVFGMETIVDPIEPFKLRNGVIVDKLGLRRFGVNDVPSTRYAYRAAHEPCIRVSLP